MNKKMREILEKIDAKTAAAKAFMEAESPDVVKAKFELDAADELRKAYEVEKRLFESQREEVPDVDESAPKDDAETKAFGDYLHGTKKALSAGNNGDIIPVTIANKIIEAAIELSPIVSLATRYDVAGDLVIPAYGPDAGDSNDDIQAAYGTEFTDLTSHAGKFTAITLLSLMVGALTKISRKLINNTGFDIVAFAMRKLSEAFAKFFEKEMLIGTGETGHMTGATKTTNIVYAGGTGSSYFTADRLIDLQMEIPEVYQAASSWIMNRATFKLLRKLKDTEGNYILTKDFAVGFGWTLLDKPVHLSSNMPTDAANAITILYGDFSGMAFKVAKQLEIQVLNELFAAQNATGLVGWAEVDSKIENAEKFVAFKMAAAA